MIDFFSSQNSSQNPTLLLVVYTILMSVVLSSALAFIYEKTNKETANNRHFIQAMILIAIVAAMVMQAIGDSLARGLGMLGALSIIRFRNTVIDPRNIVFIFASLAIGIACGVYGFYVATVGTIVFILTAVVLHYSPLNQKTNMIGSLVIESKHPNIPDIEHLLSRDCKRFRRTRFTINGLDTPKKDDDNESPAPITYNHHFQFRMKDNKRAEELSSDLSKESDIMLKRFDIKNTIEST